MEGKRGRDHAGPGRAWRFAPPSFASGPPLRGSARAPGGPVGPGLGLFHDGRAELPWALEDQALTLDAGGFDGTWLSLALDLPPDLARRLRRSSVLALEGAFTPPPANRLRLASGQFISTIWFRAMPDGGPPACDLTGAELDPSEADKAWIDLIHAAPFAGPLVIRGLTLSHRQLAGF